MKTQDGINLDKFLGKARNFIELAGVELEGGWTSLPPGANIVHDGSVQVPQPASTNGASLSYARERQRNVDAFNAGNISRTIYTARAREIDVRERVANVYWQTGELPSEPRPTHEIATWMRAYYPQHVNDTCGLHVHMSFKSVLHYQRLMTPAFMWSIVNYVRKWAETEGLPKTHPIWPRLEGKSRYCKLQFHADLQSQQRAKDHDQQRPGNRYTAINYCFSVHQTIECRLLPMMEGADLGIRAVQNIFDITNAFLVGSREKEQALKTELKADAANARYDEHRRYTV